VRPLLIFLAGVLVVFGTLALLIMLSRPTERIFVVVDSSFPMRGVWNQVPGVLDDLEDEDYAEFALATEKGLVHTWQDSLDLRAPVPYAPCDFTGIIDHPEAAQADERVLITSGRSCPTDGLVDWRVIKLGP
jgi:hypothetical protein